MTHFETKSWLLGTIIFSSLLTGCTQFQTSLASPGSSSSSSSSSGANSQGSGPVMHQAAIATSAAQFFSDLSQAIPEFAPQFGSLSCQSISACSSGSQVLTLNNCFGVSGSTSISYSSSSCSLLSSNAIALAPDLNFSNFMTLSSANGTDYRGQSMGGGYDLNYSIANLSASFAEPGTHLVNTSTSPFDFYSRTTSPFNISLDLSNVTLSVNGGALELIDNTNQYVASLSASNLTFNTSCLYPVSGSLNGNLSGVFSGSISVAFNSCGSITVTALGQTSNATVSSCN